jgi:hypothetical protein
MRARARARGVLARLESRRTQRRRRWPRFGFGTRHASTCGIMLIRENRKVCMVIMPNGLTLELTYNEGSTYGVWLLGERLVWWVVAGAA